MRQHNLERILPKDLINFGQFEGTYPIKIDLAYAHEDNLLLGEAVYRKDAQFWMHALMVPVFLDAAKYVHEKYGYTMVFYDCLRTTDAQELMLQADRVKENPQWLEEPRLLSPPGAGAHPRAMAVDVSLLDKNGQNVDMGTEFDYLAEDSSAENNPAHRQYPYLTEVVKRNRAVLDNAIFTCAEKHGVHIEGLAQEWWDYRLPVALYQKYAPLSDADLPDNMKMAT